LFLIKPFEFRPNVVQSLEHQIQESWEFLQFNYFSINQLQYTCLSVFLESWEGLWYPWKLNKLYSLRLEILSNTKSKILSSQPGEFETALRQRICSHKLMTLRKVANQTTRLLLYSLVLYSCWKLSFLLMKGTVQPFEWWFLRLITTLLIHPFDNYVIWPGRLALMNREPMCNCVIY
jgi:hypothetical protein